jgi:hypothetical protein
VLVNVGVFSTRLGARFFSGLGGAVGRLSGATASATSAASPAAPATSRTAACAVLGSVVIVGGSVCGRAGRLALGRLARRRAATWCRGRSRRSLEQDDRYRGLSGR